MKMLTTKLFVLVTGVLLTSTLLAKSGSPPGKVTSLTSVAFEPKSEETYSITFTAPAMTVTDVAVAGFVITGKEVAINTPVLVLAQPTPVGITSTQLKVLPTSVGLANSEQYLNLKPDKPEQLLNYSYIKTTRAKIKASLLLPIKPSWQSSSLIA